MRRTFEAMNRGGGRQSHHGRGRGRGRGGWGGRGRGGGGRGGRQYHRGRGGGGRHQNDRNGNDNINAGNYVHNIGTTGAPSSASFTVAVQGCSHGELDSIYDALESYRAQKLAPQNIDVLLCCGDVQTLRNEGDFPSLNVPPKYKAMGDFHAYYSGRKVAPVLTIMIGGNHESSNYLQELSYGGWVAPNIYYMGAAGVVNLCKRTTATDGSSSAVSALRIAGISGIYNSRHYELGRFETPPYDQGELRSVYHTRQADVKRMQALGASPAPRRGIDVMISHDWPRGIAYHGNTSQLLQRKPFFRQEIEANELGSPANEALLHALKPKYWFAAHLHVKFEALVRHGGGGGGSPAGETCREVRTDAKPASTAGVERRWDAGKSTEPEDAAKTEFHGMESNDGTCPDAGSNAETLTEQMTRFLSLDKCLPKRRHIQITHVEPSFTRSANDAEPTSDTVEDDDDDGNNKAWLEYDASWLAVLRRTHGWTRRTRSVVVTEDVDPITEEEIDDISRRFEGSDDDHDPPGGTPLAIPRNFAVTVPPFDPSSARRSYGPPRGSPMVGNPQTDRLLGILGLDHRITVPFAGAVEQRHPPFFVREPPRPPLSTQLIPSAVIHGRSNNDVPNRSMDDENEIDLDDDQDETERPVNEAGEGLKCATAVNKEGSGLDEVQDPAEIDLEESEDENGETVAEDGGGDAICFSPPSGAAKKPRTEC